MSVINKESIKKLIEINKNDVDTLDFIKSFFDSFIEYHHAVYEDQIFPIIFGGAIDGEDYRDRRSSLDRTRTICHNSVISNVGILNRMAKNAGLMPIYDGIVSEEKPYRREVANAVFEYIESIINNRN